MPVSSARQNRPAVAGIGISHPERLLFPEAAATKLDLARYYERIARWIVPHVAGRPLTLVRCPEGTRMGSREQHRAPECFYMKHAKVWAPPALRRVRIREKTKIGEYLIADTAAAVVALAQMDVLEIHTWNSTFDHLEQPDRIVIDVDPGEAVGWADVVKAARLIRDMLGVIELESFVKTTGGRGVHVVVPLTPRAAWSECLDFARAFAEAIARRDPDRYTTAFAKAGRERKLLIDYLRNNRTNTSVAAFSTRAKSYAPVSVPLSWNELRPSLQPARFTIQTVPARLARRTDPWAAYWRARQTLPKNAVRALEQL